MSSNRARARQGMKGFYKYTSALVGAAAAVLPVSALAQETVPETGQVTQAATPEEEDQIVVTGTRVRSEFNSPSPVQVITTENSALAGVNNVAGMVQNSSIAAGSPQIDATISSAFVTEGGPGAQTISLRGLGANRTLVLLNGRRAGPAGTRGQVGAFDLNVVPFSLVDRVEVLKDGASSIYGSDAIAGVVNIITRRNLDGGEANFEYSLPMEEGGSEISADVAWGQTLSRGYWSASFEYYNQEETRLGQRDYTNCAVDRQFDVNTGARTDLVDVRTGDFACANNTSTGLTWLYDLSGEGQLEGDFIPNFIQYDGSGQIGALLPQTIMPTPLSPFGPTAPANWFNVSQRGDADTQGVVNTNSQFEQDSSLLPEIERGSFFAQAGFDITSNAEAYGEVLLNRRTTRTNGFRQVWTYLYSYDYGDPFSAGWGGASILSPTVITDHFDAEQVVDYRRFVVGLRGDLDGRLGPVHWDIYYQDSLSDGEYTTDVILQDAVYSADGRSDFGTGGLFNANSIPRPTASCVGYNTPISNRPCVDVNWMSPTLNNGGGFTPEEAAFLFDTDTGNTEYIQRFVEGSISAEILALPAGNVGGALGIVHRYDELSDVPGAITRSGNSWGLSSAGITTGDDATTEVFGELAVPILAHAPLAESLNLVLSGRFTDVRSYGSNETYKVGVNWQLTPEFMLRATTGTSFRAPTLFELYLAQQTAFSRQVDIDPCVRWGRGLEDGNITQRIADNCASIGIPDDYSGAGSSATIVQQGSAGALNAETSQAHVLGFVWSPRFANLNVSVDYFDIQIENDITALGGYAIVFGCMNSVDFPTDEICNLFGRGLGANPFAINVVDDAYRNISSQANRGIDLTARYEHEFPWGDFSVQAQATYQLEDKIAVFPDLTDDNNGRNGDPKFVGNLDLQLVRNDWTFFWRVDMIGETDDEYLPEVSSIDGDTRYIINADFTTYHAASVRYDFGRWSALLGVANVFDQEPPEISTAGAALQSYVGPSLLASQYDYVGRRVFLGLSAEF